MHPALPFAGAGFTHAGRLASAIALASLVVSAAMAQGAGGPSAAPPSRPAASNPARPAASRTEEGVRWQALTAAQREALAPLEKEWSGIDSARKQKWIALSARFQSLGPAERARITERMSEWARLSPVERGQARLRFEEARQLPAPDRNARWQAYQALPPDAKERFAARAASAASGSAEAARREARNARAANEGREAKANLVPNSALAQPPKQVAPTLVQAAPGATTTLITRRPAPPVHQQTGMPKIAGTAEFVNRSTLLPRRGPQAAAVTPAVPAAPAGFPGVIVSPPVIVPAMPVAPAAVAAPSGAASTP